MRSEPEGNKRYSGHSRNISESPKRGELRKKEQVQVIQA